MLVQVQRPAYVAQGALASVADDSGGDSGAMAAILLIDVLDDFLAPLMLEVDIDVRRFVALLGNEALEQHVLASRVDFGDAQRITDGGIGSGAASLAENVFG